MTVDEAKKTFEELKSQGRTEEELAGAVYLMFKDDLINVDELGKLCGLLGFELTEEFLAMSPEEQKTNGWTEGNEPIPAIQGESVENAQPKPNSNTPKQSDNGTTYEESKGKGEDGTPNNNNNNNNKESQPSNQDKDSDDERTKAMRLMGLR